jgi:hypothetical protein
MDRIAAPARTAARIFAAMTAALFAIGPAMAWAGSLSRFAANFLHFDGTQVSTTVAPAANASGGAAVYDNTIRVPASFNTLYVSISATGDLDQQSNSLLLACLIDGAPCNSGGPASNGAPTGWVMTQKLSAAAQPDTSTDNNISYTWCMPIQPNPGKSMKRLDHTVELRLASGDGTDNVSVEQMHVFVDGAKIAGRNKANACTEAMQ